jgi:hypothetical protein
MPPKPPPTPIPPADMPPAAQADVESANTIPARSDAHDTTAEYLMATSRWQNSISFSLSPFPLPFSLNCTPRLNKKILVMARIISNDGRSSNRGRCQRVERTGRAIET